MSRRLLAFLAFLAVAAPAAADARQETLPLAAKRVRNAIPAIEAFWADHGSYAGLTLARIRAYDSSVRAVAIRRAGRDGYCVESTLAGPVVHYDGPRGPLRRGRCGVRGAVVPRSP
jgi:hypothetical protein